MKMQELFNTPETWFKVNNNTHELDINNKVANDLTAAKWTLWGAYKKCYDSNTLYPEYKKLKAAMPPHKRRGILLTDFNTLSDTTYEIIAELIKSAGV